MIHKVKGYGIVNKAEVDIFPELSDFSDDPTGVSIDIKETLPDELMSDQLQED